VFVSSQLHGGTFRDAGTHQVSRGSPCSGQHVATGELRRRFPAGPVSLVYLSWEPLNATAFEPYREHALEVEKLCAKSAGANIPLISLRYCQLWEELEQINPRHAARMRERYACAVSPGRKTRGCPSSDLSAIFGSWR
jgi:hypothetical protein